MSSSHEDIPKSSLEVSFKEENITDNAAFYVGRPNSSNLKEEPSLDLAKNDWSSNDFHDEEEDDDDGEGERIDEESGSNSSLSFSDDDNSSDRSESDEKNETFAYDDTKQKSGGEEKEILDLTSERDEGNSIKNRGGQSWNSFFKAQEELQRAAKLKSLEAKRKEKEIQERIDRKLVKNEPLDEFEMKFVEERKSRLQRAKTEKKSKKSQTKEKPKKRGKSLSSQFFNAIAKGERGQDTSPRKRIPVKYDFGDSESSKVSVPSVNSSSNAALDETHKALLEQFKRQEAEEKRKRRNIPSVSLLAKPSKSAIEVLGHRYNSQPQRIMREAHSEVYIVTKKEKSRREEGVTFAIKRQFIQKPDDLNDRAYRELRILLMLSFLQEDAKCVNFVCLKEWLKSSPPLLFDGVGETVKSDASPLKSSGGLKSSKQSSKVFSSSSNYQPDDQFMFLELEYAHSRITEITKCTFNQYKGILFQIFYALYMAQKECKFVHNDLHLKNILIQTPDPLQNFLVIHDRDQIWFTRDHIVKITDFGLSRIQLIDKSVVYNPRDHFGELFSENRDLDKIKQEMRGFSPELNYEGMDEEECKAAFKDFKKRLTKAMSPGKLLSDPFFESLTKAPEDFAPDKAVFVSSSGDASLVRDILRGKKDRTELEEIASGLRADEIARANIRDISHTNSRKLARDAAELFTFYNQLSHRGGVKVNYELYSVKEEKLKEKKKRKRSRSVGSPNSSFNSSKNVLTKLNSSVIDLEGDDEASDVEVLPKPKKKDLEPLDLDFSDDDKEKDFEIDLPPAKRFKPDFSIPAVIPDPKFTEKLKFGKDRSEAKAFREMNKLSIELESRRKRKKSEGDADKQDDNKRQRVDAEIPREVRITETRTVTKTFSDGTSDRVETQTLTKTKEVVLNYPVKEMVEDSPPVDFASSQ